MKKIFTIILTTILAINSFSQTVINFPDGKLWYKMIFSTSSDYVAKNLRGQWVKIDTNNDRQIQVTEAQEISELYLRTSDISSMQGIEHFSNLKYLDVFSNNISTLNLDNNINLKTLICDNNNLTGLDLSKNLVLEYLSCSWNNIIGIILPNSNVLQKIHCMNNQISNLNMSNNVGLKVLNLENNPITSLFLKNNINLEELNFSSTLVTDIDLSYNTALLKITTSSNLITLNVTNNINLKELYTFGRKLISVDVRNGNNNNMLSVRFGDTSSSSKLQCIYVNNRSSHILTDFWIKPHTATYVESESECNAILDTKDVSKKIARIYPNPVSDLLFVSSDFDKYEILDLEGRIVKYGTASNKQIDVKQIAEGLYYLKLYSNSDYIIRKFIKKITKPF